MGVCTSVPQNVIDGCQARANSRSIYENDQFSRTRGEQQQTEPSWHRPQQGWSNNGWSSGWQGSGSAASSSWQIDPAGPAQADSDEAHDHSKGAKGDAKGGGSDAAKGGKGGKGGGGKSFNGAR